MRHLELIEYQKSKWMKSINLSLIFKVTILTLSIIGLFGCVETEEIKELKELQEEFGGQWSISESEGCILLEVTDSERFMHVEDSIDPYFETIERITKNWEVGRCIYLEHSVVTNQGLIRTENSSVYIVREL